MSIRPTRFSRARLSRPALTRAAVGAGLAPENIFGSIEGYGVGSI